MKRISHFTIKRPTTASTVAGLFFLSQPFRGKNDDETHYTPTPESPKCQAMHRMRRSIAKAEKRHAEHSEILPPMQQLRPDLAAYPGSQQMPEGDSMSIVHRQAEKAA